MQKLWPYVSEGLCLLWNKYQNFIFVQTLFGKFLNMGAIQMENMKSQALLNVLSDYARFKIPKFIVL